MALEQDRDRQGGREAGDERGQAARHGAGPWRDQVEHAAPDGRHDREMHQVKAERDAAEELRQAAFQQVLLARQVQHAEEDQDRADLVGEVKRIRRVLVAQQAVQQQDGRLRDQAAEQDAGGQGEDREALAQTPG